MASQLDGSPRHTPNATAAHRVRIGYRLATPADASDLAALHEICGRAQPEAFLPVLGLPFLSAYYRAVLKAPSFIAILAFSSETGEPLGFHSGWTDAEDRGRILRRNMARFIWPLVWRIIMRPTLVRQIAVRARGMERSGPTGPTHIGPRGEYWGWKPDTEITIGATDVHRRWHHILFALGHVSVRSEMNSSNARVVKAARLMGAKIIATIWDASSRERLIVEYDLRDYCRKFPLHNPT